MNTSETLILKLREFEGLRLEVYKDAAGVPTIGYGHTKGVRMGDKITRWWAIETLKKDIEEVAQQVDELEVAHTEGQMDALVSFAFNLGIDRLQRSTLLRLIRQGASKAAIKREFKKWVYAGGERMKGLERRRDWEAKRFFEESLIMQEVLIKDESVVMERLMKGVRVEGRIWLEKTTSGACVICFERYNRRPRTMSADWLIRRNEHGWVKESAERIKVYESIPKMLGTARVLTILDREHQSTRDALIDREIVEFC